MDFRFKNVKNLDHLFSEPVAAEIRRGLQERADQHSASRREHLEATSELFELQREAVAHDKKRLDELQRRSEKHTRKFLEKGDDSPPKDDHPLVEELAVVPTARSCISSFGPYNQWGGTDGGPGDVFWEDLGSRTLRARCFFAMAGSGRAWAGSGCWFNTSVGGQHELRVQFITNGLSLLYSGLGYAHTHLRVYGSVWGAAENAWVDRGGFGTDILNRYFLSYDPLDGDFRDVRGPFDAIPGGWYYCAGWLQIWTGIGGWGSTGGTRVATVINPLTVCSP